MTYHIQFGSSRIDFRLEYSDRKSLGITVTPNAAVVVNAPLNASLDQVRKILIKKAPWIIKQKSFFLSFHPKTPTRKYISGETHLYLGRQIRLKVVKGEPSVKMSRDQLLVTVPNTPNPNQVQLLLRRWYLDRARHIFDKILDECFIRFKGHARPQLIVRVMLLRWGSLSRPGRMTLNANLVRAPRACIEYVVTHELCHLEHRDHDAGFYRLLRRMMPDWEKRKQRLELALL